MILGPTGEPALEQEIGEPLQEVLDVQGIEQRAVELGVGGEAHGSSLMKGRRGDHCGLLGSWALGLVNESREYRALRERVPKWAATQFPPVSVRPSTPPVPLLFLRLS